MGPDPLKLGKMGRGIKIGGSRGPKWRLDPILGPFLAIFGPFGPFLTLFGHLGAEQRLQVGPDPLKLGKMGRGVKIGGSTQMASIPPFGAIFGSF